MDFRLGIYSLEPQYAYLPPAAVLLLLFILSFRLKAQTKSYSQRYHSFPALGLTSFVGGFLFLAFYIYEVRAGFTTPVLAALSVVLMGIWISARLLYPLPKQKAKVIKPRSRLSDQDIVPLDELELVDVADVDKPASR